ncbi:MAG: hypothetical protein ACW976_04690, partial [Candidatus Ranarchaeia archaeon]
EFTIYVETRQKSTFIYHTVYPGLGGLPGKTQGRLVGLLDNHGSSAMAIWLAMRRGGVLDLLFFKDNEKIIKAVSKFAKCLVKFLPEGHVTLREFDATELKKEIEKKFPQQSDLLMRRYQIRIMNDFAKKRGALGLVLGGSLAQTSPAALKWIELVDNSSVYPIYRPLLALPEETIKGFWQQISGSSTLPSTFENLIPSTADPAYLTKTLLEQVNEWEETLNLDDREVLERSVQYKLNEDGE